MALKIAPLPLGKLLLEHVLGWLECSLSWVTCFPELDLFLGCTINFLCWYQSDDGMSNKESTKMQLASTWIRFLKPRPLTGLNGTLEQGVN
jgi:hypothetical protein